MPIPENQVVVGGEYLTSSKQMRKVTEIKKDEEKRDRIVYVAKSANIPKRDYAPCVTLSNPPLRKTFAKACEKKIK